MFETLAILPLPFWLVIAFLIGGVVWAKGRLRDGSGIPMIVVLATVGAWYVGDAFYNDYANNHAKTFTSEILADAWWQVACFVSVFLVLTPLIHRWMNGSNLQFGSGLLQIFKSGIGAPLLQRRLDQLLSGCLFIWTVLVIVATIRLKGEIVYYFFPFLGYKAEPWGRGRIGQGFDALLTVAFYLQLLVTGTFGVVAALSKRRRTFLLAAGLCLASWPYFIFDRTRNTLLAVVVPGILCLCLLRVRGGIWKKVTALLICFLIVNAWMKFIIANRSNMSIAAAIQEQGFSFSGREGTKHEGLNMYEELCWVNTFMERGSYTPNWGSRYFAEIVNPIPRTLWAGKPLIGIDYAIVRGQGGGSGGEAGVYATMSTGLIGQGVVNFGTFLGPSFAALLMSFWVAVLARLDLQIQKAGRLPLYALGIILTFNLGRDITLITLYPFVFGYLLVLCLDRFQPDRVHYQARHPAITRKSQNQIVKRNKPAARGFSGGLFWKRVSPAKKSFVSRSAFNSKRGITGRPL